MENMQILHECRDSRDDHFAERRNRVHRAVKSTGSRRHDLADDFSGEDVTETMILDHLEGLASRFSLKTTAANEAILECINYAEEAGMYSNATDLGENPEDMEECAAAEKNQTILVNDTYLEDTWEKAYDERRDQYKPKSSAPSDAPVSNLPALSSTTGQNLLADGNAFRNTFSTVSNQVLEIRQDIEGSEPENNVNIEAHIAKWTLNVEQARAFRIIANHSLQDRPDQLRMFLAGPSGAGGSRVLDSLRDFFQKRGQSRRFRLAAYTGVAARNIQGMTLHAALCLKQRGNGSAQAKTRRDLTAMWEGIDYLSL
jgi:hypothetical protein